MSTRTKMILGLVGAAAVGVAIGMMLAPEAGQDTRKRISNKAGDWSHSLGDLFNSAKENVESMRRKGSEMSARTARKYSDLKESYS